MGRQSYDNDAILEMCSNIDLMDYAMNSFSIDFEKRGSETFAASCPKHVDKTPSLVITPKKNLFHCFSCGIGGNILNWIMTFEGLSFDDALEKVGKLAGVDINNLKQCSALSIYRNIHHNTIKKGDKLSSNTQRITLDESEIEKYTDEIPLEWIEEGIDSDIMRKYNIRVDEKANRIIYPVYDNNLKLIGFKGRTRFENYKIMRIKKYQNYQKIGTTDFFIGMKENYKRIKELSEVIIFEGIKSGMKVEAWGYKHWLSSETGWLNDEQVLILIQLGVKSVIIAYDNDVALSKIRDCTVNLRKFTNVYVIMDRTHIKDKLLGNSDDKVSPCDKGREVWEILYRERKKV